MLRFISLLVLLLVVSAKDLSDTSSDEATLEESIPEDTSPSEDVRIHESPEESSTDSDGSIRTKRQYNYYPNYYYNPLGTGSAWAAGGGLVGNTLSFIAG